MRQYNNSPSHAHQGYQGNQGNQHRQYNNASRQRPPQAPHNNGSYQASTNTPPAKPETDESNSEKKRYMNIKSHGKNTAVEVAPDETSKGWYTIRIEAAPKLEGNTKAFNWNSKISLQVTKTELPTVIATLAGYLPSCQFNNHGDSNKWFSIENQGTNFFIKVGEPTSRTILPCPVQLTEGHLMAMVALSQYVKNFENMSTDAALEAIKVMSSHMVKNNAFPAAQQPNRARS